MILSDNCMNGKYDEQTLKWIHSGFKNQLYKNCGIHDECPLRVCKECDYTCFGIENGKCCMCRGADTACYACTEAGYLVEE